MLKVIELFAGIGAVHQALKELDHNSFDFKIIDMVENDKNAVKAYNVIHNTDFEPQDILTWNKNIECDYLHASTPCQAFSVNGKNLGAEDKRGLQLWEATIKVIKQTKPKWITLENVKGLLSKKHKNVVDYYLLELEKLGYVTKHFLLNAKNLGSPQNRERVFFISFKDNFKLNCELQLSNIAHFFPSPILTLNNILDSAEKWETITIDNYKNEKYLYIKNNLSLYNGLAMEIDLEKYKNNKKTNEILKIGILKNIKFSEMTTQDFILTNEKITNLIDYPYASGGSTYKSDEGIINTLDTRIDTKRIINIKNYGFEQDARVSSIDGVSYCLDTNLENKKIMDVLFNEDNNFKSIDGISGTITANNAIFKNKILKVSNDNLDNLIIRYRKLSNLEACRLMGFDDKIYFKLQENKIPKIGQLFGNSIVVSVMNAILLSIFEKELKELDNEKI